MPPENQQQDPYEFINNPASRPRRRINFGKTKNQRIVVVVVGFVFLVIMFFVLSSFFNSTSNSQKTHLAELAQTQTEIIRLSAIADKQSSDTYTRSTAATTKLVVESDLKEIEELLARRKSKLNNKSLSAKENKRVDNELEEAFSNNRFDKAFDSTIKQQLLDYQVQLQTAAGLFSGNEKNTLQTSSDDITLLIERINNQ